MDHIGTFSVIQGHLTVSLVIFYQFNQFGPFSAISLLEVVAKIAEIDCLRSRVLAIYLIAHKSPVYQNLWFFMGQKYFFTTWARNMQRFPRICNFVQNSCQKSWFLLSFQNQRSETTRQCFKIFPMF